MKSGIIGVGSIGVSAVQRLRHDRHMEKTAKKGGA
jgi:hypothetical protein